MAAKTVYAQKLVQNALLRGSSFISPSALYIALFTTAPTDLYTSASPTGVEITGNNYARQSITFNTPTGVPATTTNTGLITFPVSTADWGTVVSFGLFDTQVNGNLLEWANLTPPVTITVAQIGKFQVGSLSAIEN